MKNALALVALASCLTTAAHAEGTPQVPEGLLSCSKLQDEAERVRCYDAQVAAMKKAAQGAAPAGAASPATTGAPATVAAPAATAPPSASQGAREESRAAAAVPAAAAPSTPAQSSVLTERSLVAEFGQEQLPPSRQPKGKRSGETLSTRITAVSKGATPGVYFYSLANGQIWREEGSEIAIFFHAGAPVRIVRSAFASYHMWTPAVGAKNWMYVTRMR